MHIERIYISAAPGEAQTQCNRIDAIVGAGINGDRNFGKNEYAGQNLTLVEAEEIEMFCADQQRVVDYSITRRNLVTRGVQLNLLVGSTFRVGEVVLYGVELCEPCLTLGNILSTREFSAKDVVKYWLHRGGLRANVLASGTIEVGAVIQIDG